MIFFGIEDSFASEQMWEKGLRELSFSFFHKFSRMTMASTENRYKLAQYLEKEPRFETCKNFKEALEFNAHIFSVLSKYLDDKRIIVGGDHAISMATVEATLASLKDGDKINIIWIDAHGDYNNPESSPSGNIHGMPLYYLLERSSYKKRINKVFLIGTTTVDSKESDLIAAQEKIIHMPYESIQTMDQVWNKIQRLSDGYKFHLSFDVDALNYADAPGTGCKIESGFTWSELELFLRLFLESREYLAVDITEYNPDLDQNDKTRDIISQILNLITTVNHDEADMSGKLTMATSSQLAKKHLQIHHDFIM